MDDDSSCAKKFGQAIRYCTTAATKISSSLNFLSDDFWNRPSSCDNVRVVRVHRKCSTDAQIDTVRFSDDKCDHVKWNYIAPHSIDDQTEIFLYWQLYHTIRVDCQYPPGRGSSPYHINAAAHKISLLTFYGRNYAAHDRVVHFCMHADRPLTDDEVGLDCGRLLAVISSEASVFLLSSLRKLASLNILQDARLRSTHSSARTPQRVIDRRTYSEADAFVRFI